MSSEHPPTAKQTRLAAHRRDPRDGYLTTDQGIRVEDTDNSLRAGTRGPILLADFHLREKLMRFDHERIPERVVYARGAGAHGWFQVYDGSLAESTTAEFLGDPSLRTPVFVRFSTLQGGRGSADTPRDVRGFATRFYTGQGNFDLVGTNMPVFFIQDGIKFPDLVHALKPEPHNEIPTASPGHDTFWDFVSLQPETLHHVMWLMSDRALPRSYRMMQGFGVHTFRLVNGAGRTTFVKFHWKPTLGVHSLVWDEAQKISGQDPDFNRRDLWEAIEAGQFPEYELGLQLIPEEREFDFDDVDLLDPTKLIPEEVVPVTPVGRMVLDRNPDNFFAETEQVAFRVDNVVPGIDFTADALLQARLFSYPDTQLTRLGGPNAAQLPVNQPVAPVAHYQQDGFGQQTVRQGRANYHPNSLGDGRPVVAGRQGGGFTHFPERIDGMPERRRSQTFADHYSQPTLFWNSMSLWEKEHIVAAFRVELGRVGPRHIRELMVQHLNRIDHELAQLVAAGIGVTAPARRGDNHGRGSRALSQAYGPRHSVLGRKVAIVVADGVDGDTAATLRAALTERGALVELLGPVDGVVTAADGAALAVTRAIGGVGSVLYDAVLVPGGNDAAIALVSDGYVVHFVAEAYKHAKPVGVLGEATTLLTQTQLPMPALDDDGFGEELGLVVQSARGTVGDAFVTAYVDAIARHRHFDRAVDAIAA
ncbi:catalase [Micromonospora pattaloongensis]|uniref:Catalase n=1 Tax=Micromonospora pattaloongensis TaxID=405436 RepID=A0A1H3FVL3_9ACTN|nr:catalase [Micromonospora pattaloongensis]SDX94398.1 catalase [Micromonospora pattaloongensis]